ncbi:MAG: ABC transporter substrate-binding protein [Fusobacteriaceae bacterium]|jgi:branched-chain amino acid transport system substrate-binding protein|nr:ABC transporter substrate-binding protein [Fusobacteriaceae bacterium]
MKKLFLSAVLCLLGLFSALTFGAAKDGEVTVGVTLPLTGDLAFSGQQVRQGMNMAVEEINENGGILGKTLKLDFQDDKRDPTEGANTYQLLKGRGYPIIIGSLTSGVTAGIAAKADVDKIPVLTPTGTADMLTEGKSFMFRACFVDSYQGKIVAQFASETLKVKKAAVLYCSADEYSLGLYESFATACKSFGIEIVEKEISTTMTDVDYSAQLSKIKESGAEMIFLPYYYGTAALIVVQAREAGFTGALIGADGWSSIGTKVGDNVEMFKDCYFTNHYSVEDPDPAVQNFVKKYLAKYSADTLTSGAALGYDCVYIAAQAMTEAGTTTDREKIAEALRKIKFSGTSGTFTLEGGNPQKSVVIIGLVDGQEKWITTVKPN